MRSVQRHHAHRRAARAEAEEVDLLESEGVNEGDDVGCPSGISAGHGAVAPSDARLVEDDYWTLGGEVVDEGRVPEVHVATKVHVKDQGGAFVTAEATIGEGCAVGGFDVLRTCCLLGRHDDGFD